MRIPTSAESREISEEKIVTVPVYQQLLRLCKQAIDEGKFKPGERFPSERDMALQYGVSRTTANKVIAHMLAERLLVNRPGMGTFVVESKTLQASLREMESFTDAVKACGMKPTTNVIAFRALRYTDVPAMVWKNFGEAYSNPQALVYVERLRIADGEPVILEMRWVRDQLVPGLTEKAMAGSFYNLLKEQYKLEIKGERTAIRAVKLARDEAALLKDKSGAAALEVKGTAFATGGEPIWFERLLYRGDRYELHNEISAERQINRTEVQFITPSNS